MGARIPPLTVNIMLESNPPKSTMLGRLGVRGGYSKKEEERYREGEERGEQERRGRGRK